MLVLDGKTLVYDRPFSHGGVNYPANWLRLTTLAEKQAIGITEVVSAPAQAYNQKFYWGPNNPKDLDELKTLWKATTSETANKLLQPSDWYAIRKADSGVAIPADWTTWRESIRTGASTRQTAIDAVTTVPELETYIESPEYVTWPY